MRFQVSINAIFKQICSDLYSYRQQIETVDLTLEWNYLLGLFRNQDYVLQLVKAVDYFQKTAKYIHMDIKPDNILVTSKDIIKLTDFGCAVPMKSPRHVHRLHNGGTEPYRPPEMFKKPKQFDSTVSLTF